MVNQGQVMQPNNGYMNNGGYEDIELKGFKKLMYLFSHQGNDGSSIRDWLITLLLLCVPIYNIIYMIKNVEDEETPNYKKTLFTTLLGFTGLTLLIGLIAGIIAIIV